MKTSDQLKKAKDLIVNTGWIKGKLIEFKQPAHQASMVIEGYCAIGALEDVYASDKAIDIVSWLCPVSKYITLSNYDAIFRYNDHPRTSKKKIVELFENAIAIAEAEEEFKKGR